MLPSWWTIVEQDGGFFLERTDGIKLSTFKTQMGFWGWAIIKGVEHFQTKYTEGLRDDDGGYFPVVVEQPYEYPEPRSFVFELDAHYPLEN